LEVSNLLRDILLVEDNPVDALLMQRLVRRYENYRVCSATTLKESLAELVDTNIKLVLLDLCLPYCRGPGSIAQILR
jgi:CheY-like chemotaxis protein